MSIQLQPHAGAWRLTGELESSPPPLTWWLQQLPQAEGEFVQLDLLEFELEGNDALLGMVAILRQLSGAGYCLRLHRSPQMLAHTLYRVGELEHGRVVIGSMREEEPYG